MCDRDRAVLNRVIVVPPPSCEQPAAGLPSCCPSVQRRFGGARHKHFPLLPGTARLQQPGELPQVCAELLYCPDTAKVTGGFYLLL